MARGIEKPRNVEDASDKGKPWELTEIVDHLQCRAVTMPESNDSASKVLLQNSFFPTYFFCLICYHCCSISLSYH